MTKDSHKRFVFDFPNSEGFFDRVHDRLHTVVERYVYLQQKNPKFTLIVNSVPRDKPNEYDRQSDMPLRYVSTSKQRAFLEPEKVSDLNDAWKGLEDGILTSDKVEEAAILYPKVRDQKYYYNDVVSSKNTLATYFDTSKYPLNEMQVFEKPILEHHFKIEAPNSDCFIAIPLIQFGEIDGFVYIVYKHEDQHLYSEDNIKDIITGFSIEYEGVIFAWDLVEDKQNRAFNFRRLIKEICADDNDQFFADKSPIFRELNYAEYYRRHRSYFENRIEQHDQMLADIYQQLVKNGVTTILLDSYAHNISAHAMTTLTWIFKKRSKIKLKEQHLAMVKAKVTSLTKAMRNKYESVDDDPSDIYKPLIEYSGSLTNEIFPFLKFLQEKGGFWSGLIRDMNAGGQVSTLYSVLWYDFVANALYLGTIAESENIRRLHIDITLHPPAKNIIEDKNLITTLSKSSRTLRLATIDLETEIKHEFDPKGKDGINAEGDFYLFSAKQEEGKEGEKMWYEDYPSFAALSRFVQPGKDFAELKKALKDIKVFFPGSIVGKHAFFTIIENELRNIKHYFGDILKRAQKKSAGLSLNISIQPCSLDDNDNPELYRIGLWLGLESKLSQPDRDDKNPYLVKRRFDMLWSDIIDDATRQPQLGGNSQDKVCAAMLFNNSFSSVQRGSFRNLALKPNAVKLDRDAIFYPWISPAVCFKASNTEFQIPAAAANFSLTGNAEDFVERPHYQDEEKAFKEKIEAEYKKYEAEQSAQGEQKGYLKKYLFLWKGEEIRTHQHPGALELDNLGRFKFVLATPDNADLWQNARENGVIRLIRHLPAEENQNERTMLVAAYKQWLHIWVKEEKMAVSFTDADGAEIGAFLLDKSAEEPLIFYTSPLGDEKSGSIQRRTSVESAKMVEQLVGQNEVECRLQCVHNIVNREANMIRYRRHGILNREFVKSPKIEENLLLNFISSEKLLELFETTVTRICLFDNRLDNRIDPNRFEFYRDKLRLFFRPESTPERNGAGAWSGKWEDAATKAQVGNCHFLVMHLSFIDRIVQEKYSGEKGFEEGNIGMFIEKEIVPIVGENEAGTGLRENFILIVTTGRGRQNWKEFLTREKYKKYSKNVIFRPIESLISAMEDSLMLNDDFELKYRLTKVLFGS